MIADVARDLLKDKHIFTETDIGEVELLMFDEGDHFTFFLRYQDNDVGYLQYRRPYGIDYYVETSSFRVHKYPHFKQFNFPYSDDYALFVNSECRNITGRFKGFGQFLVMLGLGVLEEYSKSEYNKHKPIRAAFTYVGNMGKFYHKLGFELIDDMYKFAIFESPPMKIKKIELVKF